MPDRTDRDPFRYLRDYWPRTRVLFRDMPAGRRGQTLWLPDATEVQIDGNLGEADRAAVAAHEMIHLELGEPDRWTYDHEEGVAIRQAARWQLPDVGALRFAIRQHGSYEAAELLGVPARVLLTRIRGLTAGETNEVFR